MAKKNKNQQPTPAPRPKSDPYYPTDYSVGRKQKPVAKPVRAYSPVLSSKKWLGIIVLGFLPLFNFIPLLAWMNKKNTKVGENQRNFAKAAALISLLFWIIAIVAIVLIVFVFKLIPLDGLFTEPSLPEEEVEAVIRALI